MLNFEFEMARRSIGLCELPTAALRKLSSPTQLLTALAMACVPILVQAKQCDATGGLRYLGTNNQQSQSVWLSSTSAGSFTLESAQGAQLVDEWSKSKRGLRLSLSPVVSSGNGGTHKLYDASGGCILDTQNQKGGIVFPPLQRPPKPPVTGVTPELPMGVKPPIGTLPAKPPVTGVMPELPMGVKPPIGTLPAKPPVTGVMPELPMGVKPPIGTLPAKPPVTGVMPELPSGVKPPIAILPPERPPVIGVTPELPVNPPTTGGEILVRTDVESSRQAGALTPCVQQQDTNQATPSDTNLSVNCSGIQLQPTNSSVQAELPPTEGREFNLDGEWNTWVDTRYTDLSDQRNGLDLSGHSGSVMVGVDRRLDSGLIAGLMVGTDKNKSSAFDGAMEVKSHGLNIGAYMAYPYSANWVFDGSLSYGYINNDQKLLILAGDFNTHSVSMNANINGQYRWGEAFLRPRLGVNYSHSRTESYDLSGTLGPHHLVLNNAKQSSNLGAFDGALEINRTYFLKNGNPVMPYGELSVQYEFDRINGGKVMTGDLSMAETSPWRGGAKFGIRSLLGHATSIDASVGYNSLGTSDLSIWEYRLFVAHSF